MTIKKVHVSDRQANHTISTPPPDLSTGKRGEINQTGKTLHLPSLQHADFKKHINTLSSHEFGGRSILNGSAEKAGEYIANRFSIIGLTPLGDNETFFQRWDTSLGPNGEELSLANVIGYLPGRDPRLKDEYVIIGAHYDHLGLGWPDVRSGNEGKIHPGADDNASGISTLIELARIFSFHKSNDRSVVFVAFTAEENGAIGSKYFTEHAPFPLLKASAMINIDSVGRLRDGKLLIFGTGTAREIPHVVRQCADKIPALRVEMISDPLTPSDQTPFVLKGIPGFQLNTGAHIDYHSPSDTPEKINYSGLVNVTGYAYRCIAEISSKFVTITPTIPDSILTAYHVKSSETSKVDSHHMGIAHLHTTHPGGNPTRRRVSLGTIPDFTFQNGGYRIEGVRSGSPAEKSGLEEGDVIRTVNDMKIHNLKDFSAAMQSFSPGDTVTLTFTRRNKLLETKAILEMR
jgi:hypothetical protein